MISRRSFLQFLGLGVAYLSVGFSIAKAQYNKSVIFLSDFGGIVKKPVKGITDNLEEARETIKKGGLVHPRGTGHSVMGRSMKEDALIYTPEETDIRLVNDVVYASAATTLLDIDNYLELFGYMLPTSPDHRAVSLGGVLSVGGYGCEVCRYGALVDHVMVMDFMTKDGQILRNLPGNHPIVKKALCGLGEHGTILSAGVKCFPKPVTSYLDRQPMPDGVDFYMEKAREFVSTPPSDDKPDVWYAYWARRRNEFVKGQAIYKENYNTVKKGKREERSDYRAFRKRRSDRWVFREQYEYYIWSDHFFTIDNFQEPLKQSLDIMKEGEEDGGSVVIYSSIVKGNKEDKHFPHYTDADYLLSVGIFANFLGKDRKAAEKSARAQMLFSKEAQEKYNGNAYKYGWEWRENFKYLDVNGAES